jgi:hypothetical protein
MSLPDVGQLVQEVVPQTMDKAGDFRLILPQGKGFIKKGQGILRSE